MISSGQRRSNLVDVDSLDPSIKLCIRYATPNNFLGRPFYSEARALLQLPVAVDLVAAHRELLAESHGLVIFDAYRPWSVTKLLWELTPERDRQFVANPEPGSVHNRGCAADVSIYCVKDDRELEMPSEYDEMSERAASSFEGATREQTRNREMLRLVMERHRFTVHPLEWWHFDHATWPHYAIEDRPFSVIPRQRPDPVPQSST